MLSIVCDHTTWFSDLLARIWSTASAKLLTMASGLTVGWFSSLDLNFPVLTSNARISIIEMLKTNFDINFMLTVILSAANIAINIITNHNNIFWFEIHWLDCRRIVLFGRFSHYNSCQIASVFKSSRICAQIQNQFTLFFVIFSLRQT